MGGLPTGTVNGFAVDPSNANVMYVAMRDGIFRSTNGGGERGLRGDDGQLARTERGWRCPLDRHEVSSAVGWWVGKPDSTGPEEHQTARRLRSSH